jgi:hypothetical protein
MCKTSSSFAEAKGKSLVGVPGEAVSIIETLQPYSTHKDAKYLRLLDELTNENKHRRILLTSLATIFKPDDPVPFPHIELEITRFRGSNVILGERLLAWIAFQSAIVKSREVTLTLANLMDWVGLDILPQFERFF